MQIWKITTEYQEIIGLKMWSLCVKMYNNVYSVYIARKGR